jgi:hypothetical protein
MTIAENLKVIQSLSNEDLILRTNGKGDFHWDDEGAEISKRMEAGTLNCKMDGNRIVIIKPTTT